MKNACLFVVSLVQLTLMGAAFGAGPVLGFYGASKMVNKYEEYQANKREESTEEESNS